MNKADGLFAGGIASWLYSMVGPATEIIQFTTALLGLVAVILSIYLYIKRIKNEGKND